MQMFKVVHACNMYWNSGEVNAGDFHDSMGMISGTKGDKKDKP